jgi:hypothetical protein
MARPHATPKKTISTKADSRLEAQVDHYAAERQISRCAAMAELLTIGFRERAALSPGSCAMIPRAVAGQGEGSALEVRICLPATHPWLPRALWVCEQVEAVAKGTTNTSALERRTMPWAN